MKDFPFLVGESTTFKEEIGQKHFYSYPSRTKKRYKRYGSIFSFITQTHNQVDIMQKVSDSYRKYIKESKNVRLSLKKAIAENDIIGDFFIGVFYGRKIYYVYTEEIDVYLMRNEQLRKLSNYQHDFVEKEAGYYLGDHLIFSSDRIAAFSREISEVLQKREIKDILCEYKEKISSKELLNAAFEKTDNENLIVMTIKVNNLSKVLSRFKAKPIIFAVLIILAAFFIFNFVANNQKFLTGLFERKKQNKKTESTPPKTEQKQTEVLVKNKMNIPLMSKVKWSREFEKDLTSSPVVFRDTLYVCSKDKYIYAIDIDSKQMKWKKYMAYKIAATPFIDNSGLYVGTYKGFFYKLSLKNGEIVWKFGSNQRIISSASADKKAVYFGSNDGFIYSLNKETGKLNWRVLTQNIVWSSPVLKNNLLMVGSLDNNFYAIDTESGKIKWKRTFANQIYSSPAVLNNKVYIGVSDNNLYCLEVDSGEILWSFGTDKEVASKIGVDKEFVYFGNEAGMFYKVKAETGESVWKYNTKGPIRSKPEFYDGVVYITSYDGFVYALKKDDGALVWKGEMSGKIHSSSEQYKSSLFVGDLNGVLKEFETNLYNLKPVSLDDNE
ncbi:MAG: PQQ-binding-like beta-propeller repeat protein [Candidatus Mcinerneyibacterium aminivorans]|uniref:PQQ-binding-like beta-propeller repeat protein n=1 Tax=Candidatus Mcinerneyibacterium aminivorans TaxID=2703815 RepID=A0A5D0MEA8_9BACT|nr:MAG: PQQ-binding-like beta-propeller repeat protein [Candidatus Mcinerneyibacterium aminivorans]